MAGVVNQRSAGLIDSLNQHVFHILGCGAIGSSAATQLTRMGAEKFILYDMDSYMRNIIFKCNKLNN